MLTQTTLEVVAFHPEVLKGIRAHAEKEAAKGGYEAVGFLACKDINVITSRVVLANHAADPTVTFFVEPWEQYRAERTLGEAGYTIAGVYHSHPQGEAIPSKTDVAMARPGELMVIHSVAFGDTTAWREREGQLYRVDIKPFDPKEQHA